VSERLQIRLLAMLLGAAGIAAVDQWVKLLVPTPDWAYHHRSEGWFALSAVLFICMVALAVLPSAAAALGAALFAGGLLGNMVSAGTDDFYIPNPLLVGHTAGIAFNVADVGIVAGNLTLVLACSILAIRHRSQIEAWRGSMRTRLRGR